jgi:dihydroorotase
MIDFWPRPERPYRELLLEHLRPGDIHTHVYAAQFPILDETGRVQAFMGEARRRGIIFDVGHGAGSFWFRQAVPAIQQGFLPDSISTDMHKTSILIPQATMPLTMSKLLNIGMPLADVIRRSTVNPAREIGRPELGTLTPGAGADVAVFQVEEGDFGFVDSGHARMPGTRRLRCLMTLRDGQVVWDLNGLAFKDWREAGNYGRLDIYGEETNSPLLKRLLQTTA